jgi:hypothetical protein
MMKAFGAPIEPADAKIIAEYLARIWSATLIAKRMQG